MAQRKVRRVKKRKANQARQQTVTVPRTETSSRKDGGSVARRYAASEDELRQEYTYVVKDLRRMAIIAAGMFILLIVLGLVL